MAILSEPQLGEVIKNHITAINQALKAGNDALATQALLDFGAFTQEQFPGENLDEMRIKAINYAAHFIQDELPDVTLLTALSQARLIIYSERAEKAELSERCKYDALSRGINAFSLFMGEDRTSEQMNKIYAEPEFKEFTDEKASQLKQLIIDATFQPLPLIKEQIDADHEINAIKITLQKSLITLAEQIKAKAAHFPKAIRDQYPISSPNAMRKLAEAIILGLVDSDDELKRMTALYIAQSIRYQNLRKDKDPVLRLEYDKATVSEKNESPDFIKEYILASNQINALRTGLEERLRLLKEILKAEIAQFPITPSDNEILEFITAIANDETTSPGIKMAATAYINTSNRYRDLRKVIASDDEPKIKLQHYEQMQKNKEVNPIQVIQLHIKADNWIKKLVQAEQVCLEHLETVIREEAKKLPAAVQRLYSFLATSDDVENFARAMGEQNELNEASSALKIAAASYLAITELHKQLTQPGDSITKLQQYNATFQKPDTARALNTNSDSLVIKFVKLVNYILAKIGLNQNAALLEQSPFDSQQQTLLKNTAKTLSEVEPEILPPKPP